jgi:hypothetical protein
MLDVLTQSIVSDGIIYVIAQAGFGDILKANADIELNDLAVCLFFIGGANVHCNLHVINIELAMHVFINAGLPCGAA